MRQLFKNTSFKKSFSTVLIGLPLLAILSVAGSLAMTRTTNAQVQNWDPGNIISDGIFTNSNTMTVQSIQAFLNSKVTTCDTNGTQTSEYGGGTRAQWAAAHNYYPPFTCLKDYSENGLSSAQIIYNIAQQYSINPQVLIVLLQKEQGLVTDTWPVTGEYKTATGYGCPDTAACDTQYYGFTNQLTWAAKMYHAIETVSPTWYAPYVLGNNTILYNPTTSCGSTTVNIQNRATQALYNYTPYQPDAAALAADLGSGDSCSSYGNRNFYEYFNSWFGSTRIQVLGAINDRYNALGGASGVLGQATMNQVCGLTNGGCYQGFQNGGIYASGPGAYESYGPIRDRYVAIGAETSTLGYPTGSVQCATQNDNCYQTYQNGVIYYTSSVGTAYEISGAIRDRYASLDAENSALGYPASPQVCGLTNGGCYQGFQNGGIYWSPATGAFENYGPIRQEYLLTGTQSGSLGYPTSALTCGSRNNGCYQMYAAGSIYSTTATGAHAVPQSLFGAWNSLGKEWGALGYPTAEAGVASGGLSSQAFENGALYQTPSGQYDVLSQMLGRWNELGNITGKLGYPTSNTNCGSRDGGCYQTFGSGNTIYWSSATGAKTVWGGIYAKWNTLGKEWGTLGYPTSNEYYANGNSLQDFQGGTITWMPTGATTVSYH